MTVIEIGDAMLRRRGRAHKPQELVGRGRDLVVIHAFVDDLPAHGGALLLSGEPGVGKSALLDAADEMATTVGIRVLRAAGAKFEDASFSVLNQLLLPLRGDLNQLNGLQRNALNVALGFTGGPTPDRLVVSNAALELLWQAAADRPLLMIIDNLQWVDRASAQVLGFVARRLSGTAVGFLAAQQSGASRLFELGKPARDVPPLDDEASERLVVTRFPDLAPKIRQRIVAEARGTRWPCWNCLRRLVISSARPSPRCRRSCRSAATSGCTCHRESWPCPWLPATCCSAPGPGRGVERPARAQGVAPGWRGHRTG